MTVAPPTVTPPPAEPPPVPPEPPPDDPPLLGGSLVYVAIVVSPLPIETLMEGADGDSSLAAGLTDADTNGNALAFCATVTVELYSQSPSFVTGLGTIVHDPNGTAAVVVLPAGVGDETVKVSTAEAGAFASGLSQIFSVPSGSLAFVNAICVSPEPSSTAS
jgi:hypothetical protein